MNDDMRADLIRFRRDLHRIPELDRDLTKTTAYLRRYLSELDCELIDIPSSEPSMKSPGFAVYFAAGGADTASESIAFRTDMDALPVEEEHETDYRSEHPGCMHACGHDAHMAIMLGFAGSVSRRAKDMSCNVLLIFQAAEETTGGAADIVASDLFERYDVSAVYGLHLWPGYPKDCVICRANEFMASTLVLDVKVEGEAVHVGEYKKGIDALEAACSLVGRVYDMESDCLPADVRRLLRFGVFESGTAVNVVPASALLKGTLRTFSEELSEDLWMRINDIAADISRETGALFTLSHSVPYPPVINPEGLFYAAKDLLETAGFVFFEPPEPLMLSEDFSCYQKVVPGLYFHLGTGMDEALHSSRYEIDEDVLVTGVRLFETLAGIDDAEK